MGTSPRQLRSAGGAAVAQVAVTILLTVVLLLMERGSGGLWVYAIDLLLFLGLVLFLVVYATLLRLLNERVRVSYVPTLMIGVIIFGAISYAAPLLLKLLPPIDGIFPQLSLAVPAAPARLLKFILGLRLLLAAVQFPHLKAYAVTLLLQGACFLSSFVVSIGLATVFFEVVEAIILALLFFHAAKSVASPAPAGKTEDIDLSRTF